MRIYRPADVLAKADELRGGLADGAEQVKELFELVPRLIALTQRAELLLDLAERAVARTDEAVTRTEAVVARTEALLEGVEELAPDALPVLAQIVDAIEPDEVRAINDLVDRLPQAAQQIDQIAPDVRHILDAVTDLSQAVRGVPGVDVLIRRGGRSRDEAIGGPLPDRDLGLPPE